MLRPLPYHAAPGPRRVADSAKRRQRRPSPSDARGLSRPAWPGDFELRRCLARQTFELAPAPVERPGSNVRTAIFALMLVGHSPRLLGSGTSVSEGDCEIADHVPLLLIGQAAEKRVGLHTRGHLRKRAVPRLSPARTERWQSAPCPRRSLELHRDDVLPGSRGAGGSLRAQSSRTTNALARSALSLSRRERDTLARRRIR
jgi:hypothetical protein